MQYSSEVPTNSYDISTHSLENVKIVSKNVPKQLRKTVILLIFYLKNSQKSNISLDNKNLKWGEISLSNKCFSQIHIGHNYWHLYKFL